LVGSGRCLTDYAYRDKESCRVIFIAFFVRTASSSSGSSIRDSSDLRDEFGLVVLE
jgi:hypothetical protein